MAQRKIKTPGVDHPSLNPTGQMAELAAEDESTILDQLPSLTVPQLMELANIEVAGHNRDAITFGIADELTSRRPRQGDELPDQSEVEVPKPGQPAILTKQGWLCPPSLPSEG